MDWKELFVPSIPVLEIVVRGTIVYVSLFCAIRFILKREGANVAPADLLLIVLIADASQQAMAADQKTVGDGLILAATLVGWNYLMDWLAFHFPVLDPIFFPRPLLLVEDGAMHRRNMRKELISERELRAHLHHQGFERLTQVSKAYKEGNGTVTIIPAEPEV